MRDLEIAACAICRGTNLRPDFLGRIGVVDLAGSDRVESKTSKQFNEGRG
jgi:hypothetical protein